MISIPHFTAEQSDSFSNVGRSIPFDDIKGAALSRAEALLPQWLPEGKREGHEWVALNPTRADGRLGSFKVNISTGKWKDFATQNSGRDMISLYGYLHGLKNGEAAKRLAADFGIAITPTQRTWAPITPVPDSAPTPPAAHYKHGMPARTWTYRNTHGAVLCHVYRFDKPPKDGSDKPEKEILPLTWCFCTEDGSYGWRWKALPEPRPLYRLDRLAAIPDAGVIVCEGEKATDAASELFPEHVTTSSLGGAQVPRKTDWTPLTGRNVILWPDNDEPGREYTAAVAKLLKGKAASVKVLSVPGDHAKGWDAADALAEGWAPASGYELRDVEEGTKPAPVEPIKASTIEDAIAALKASGDLDGLDLTELGMAKRLLNRHGQDLRYCHPWQKWLVWDSARWKIDDSADVGRRGLDTVLSLYREASETEGQKTRDRLVTYARGAESVSVIVGILGTARILPEMPILPDALDADAWLLNCRNGTVDLRTGELRPHRREDYITKRAETDYRLDAACPVWERFLARIFDGKRALIWFVQKAIGYTLTGLTREQVFFVLHGTGANGKSTLLGVLQSLLADYAKHAAPDIFLEKKSDRHPTELADLKGARMVASVETGKGRRLAENLIKQMTGGDRMKARRMREDFWEFMPSFKVFLATNHKPNIRGTDYAIWRRIRLIPFDVTIPPEERDPYLADKLKDEIPGILAWAVRGCLAWQQEGLHPPEEVSQATDGYRAAMDVLKAFLDECCLIDRRASVAKGDIYREYRNWCERSGEVAETQRSLSEQLQERGFTEGRIGHERTRAWAGIGLLTYADVADAADASFSIKMSPPPREENYTENYVRNVRNVRSTEPTLLPREPVEDDEPGNLVLNDARSDIEEGAI